MLVVPHAEQLVREALTDQRHVREFEFDAGEFLQAGSEILERSGRKIYNDL